MMFYNQSAEGASSGDQLGQITLPQFRGVMLAAKAITPRFAPEKVCGMGWRQEKKDVVVW